MSTRGALPSLPPPRFGQSLSGYVREHLHEFERLLYAGVGYAALLKGLKTAGMPAPTYDGLDAALYRARRRLIHARQGAPAQGASGDPLTASTPSGASLTASSRPAPLAPAQTSPVGSTPNKRRLQLTPTKQLNEDKYF